MSKEGVLKKTKRITAKILLVSLLVFVIIVTGILSVMMFYMDSLTDSIMLETLQPMAKIAAQSVEGNLHLLVDRFFQMRDNNIISSKNASVEVKQQVLDDARSGIEFVWLGIYNANGTLLTGSEECARTISGRRLYEMMRETKNLVIEDTSVGNSGLEIVMGVPVLINNNGSKSIEYYLVGSYKYDVLSDVLGNINIGANGRSFIINENAKLIAHDDMGKVYSKESISDSFENDGEVQPLISLMAARQIGAARIESPKGPLYVSYAPVRGTLWTLGIEAPRDDFIAAFRRAVYTSLTIAVVAFILATAAFDILLKKILSSPLSAITENADMLANGQFENRLSKELTDRDDEIGQLGKAFSTMSDSVQNVIVDIGQLTGSARAGALGKRANTESHKGDFNLIISGINATLDVICSHLDAMPGAFALFDEQRQPIFFNSDFENILKRHGSESYNHDLIGFLVSSGTFEKLPPEIASIFSPKGKNGDTYDTETVLPDVNGDEHNYTLVLKRISGEGHGTDEFGGQNTCVMLIMQDVTMLARAKKEAEAASHAKTDFLSNMSHEMRTPMNAIIGMTTIAKSTNDPEKKDYYLGKIEGASAHLLGVINDILDMSKIEANKLELSHDQFNFERMLQQVVNVINFRVEEKHQELSVDIDKAIPMTLISDDQRLSQVITNLLSNAAKFTPEFGVIRLKSRFIGEKDGICTLQIEVSDSGIGVTEEQKSRLFRSFEQAESSTTRKYGGTGLGLAISKRIVEMMGGQIWVESELGKGSTFAFTIQAGRGSDEDSRPLLDSKVSMDNLRILVVDDSPYVLDYFKEIFKSLKVDFDTAADGDTACGLIESSGRYDIYFVDWKLPGMDGIELTKRIKQEDSDKSVVIMISATEWAVIADDAKKAGVDKFLPKPLFPSNIISCISECLDGGLEAGDEQEELDSEEGCFRGYSILLAEDVEINREIVLTILEPTMLEVDCAENGAEALRKFSESPGKYKMIFMDVQMPEMDGFEATRRIRGMDIPEAKQIPIVAMTANVFREDIEKCLECGMNEHLGKPLDFDEVFVKLHKYLDRDTD